MEFLVTAVAVALLTSLAVMALSSLASTKASRYPPGPKGWPLIGNLFDAPKPGSEWVDYHEMCKKYNSDVVYLRVLGQSILVLDSIKAITELLDKRSDIYSSRPWIIMLHELMDVSWNFALTPYGDCWRAYRRVFQSEFTIRAGGLHHSQQTHGAHGLLVRLLGLDGPDKWRKHLRHQIGATILDIAYGISALPEDDPIIKLVEEAASLVTPATVPGRFLVETAPMLKYVPAWAPGASFQLVAQKGKAVMRDLVDIPFNNVKRAMVDGTAQPSFTLNRLQHIDLSGDVKFQETVIKGCAATMYGAGADTTVSTLSTFFLAMMKYPEVQAKAQLEIDSVLGSGHLPGFGDEASLPYISAIVKECLRWEVVTPISIPHQSTKDDEYRGYHIPAGTVVIPNTWAVLNDERMYPDPFVFNPDRFMKNGSLDPSVRDPEAAFGYGRRICPGRHMAQDTIWVNIACILACFNIEKPLDAHGNAVEPSVKYIPQILRHPEPFGCRIKPRSNQVEDMIRGLET
ncbi:cytochrome P450 [Athelia psychrophila]|uniref:Cytochrome P450 n=1 Tax=Athelia psychrophila TaxID=1759441 RepID=A0A166LSF5_9AGAM|nr:cytochrome P450 [Fibularhizoctonia sp. CBS 109695]